MLCAALLVREPEEIRRLLRLPLATELPRRVRAEALLIARGGAGGLRAPVHTLHFFHQMEQLLGARAGRARSNAAPDEPPAERSQLELELPVAVGG